MVLNFLSLKRIIVKIEIKSNIDIKVYGYKKVLICSVHIPDKKFENYVDLLLIMNGNNSHCVYVNSFNRFTYN